MPMIVSGFLFVCPRPLVSERRGQHPSRLAGDCLLSRFSKPATINMLNMRVNGGFEVPREKPRLVRSIIDAHKKEILSSRG